MKKIAILLSTYNGDLYIEEQIESIYNQSYTNFELYVRDDGSNKDFVTLLKKLQKKYQFSLIEGENIGFVRSFMMLLEMVNDADLYAFADQDDVWLRDKLRVAENWFAQNGKNDIPQLFHSAYSIFVNELDNVVGNFGVLNSRYDFRRSITENHFSGFAMVINPCLREYMLKGDCNKIGYHDWWAAMITQAFGESYSDSRIMAMHRAHGDNVTTINIKTRIKWFWSSLKQETDIHKRVEEFSKCFAKKISKNDLKTLNLFCYKKYNLIKSLKKCFYFKRWRPIISSEISIRILMLMGRL